MSAKSDIWAKGVPLYQALFRFGDSARANRLVQIQKSHPLIRAMTALTKSLENKAPVLDDADYQNSISENSEALKLRRGLERQLLANIKARNLVALGFALPREPSDEPVIVPHDVWGGKINWQQSSVTGNGLEFAAVRISAERSEQTSTILGRRPGRPSRRDHAIKAFRVLDAEGKIDRNASLSVHFEMIRERANELFPGEDDPKRGLGKHVLYQVLTPLFDNKN